jgi:hypothetical protein
MSIKDLGDPVNWWNVIPVGASLIEIDPNQKAVFMLGSLFWTVDLWNDACLPGRWSVCEECNYLAIGPEAAPELHDITCSHANGI